jgi:ABC-type cobalamin/Fe3+-siderophores transport system ATPase subunit
MRDFIHVKNLTFSYPNCTTPLFEMVSFQLHTGWTGIVGPNGSGKSTLLKLITGILIPDSGFITTKSTTYYSEQRTDLMPLDLKYFFESTNKHSSKIKTSLEIEANWQYRWQSLSQGERKRCQIAVALYKNQLQNSKQLATKKPISQELVLRGVIPLVFFPFLFKQLIYF